MKILGKEPREPRLRSSRLDGIIVTAMFLMAVLIFALPLGPTGLVSAEPLQNSSFALRQVECVGSSLLFAKSGPGTFYALPPDSSYFYYRAESFTEGRNQDSDANTVPEGIVADSDALEMVDWEPKLDNAWVKTFYLSESRKVTAQYKGDEYSLTFSVEYKVPKSEAGQRTRLFVQCNIVPESSADDMYGVWASKLVPQPIFEGITVHFDSYSSPYDEFERYEALYRVSGTTTWNVGASTTTQTASSLEIGGLDCQKTYEVKARIVWTSGAFTNAHSETYIDSASPGCAHLEGVVYDGATGYPLSGVEVKIQGRKTSTDSNGYYSLMNLETGKWMIEFSHPMYHPKSYEIELVPGWNEASTSLTPKDDTGGGTPASEPSSLTMGGLEVYYRQ